MFTSCRMLKDETKIVDLSLMCQTRFLPVVWQKNSSSRPRRVISLETSAYEPLNCTDSTDFMQTWTNLLIFESLFLRNCVKHKS